MLLAMIIGQVVTQRAASSTTKAGADGGAGFATELVAHQRAAGRTQAAANRCLGLVALLRAHGAACGTADASTNGSAGAATELLADYVTQDTAQATAYSSLAITGHGTLCAQQAQGQGGKSLTHFVSTSKFERRAFCWSQRPGAMLASAVVDLRAAKSPHEGGLLLSDLVGETGFEPAAFSSRTRRATWLRYTPMEKILLKFFSSTSPSRGLSQASEILDGTNLILVDAGLFAIELFELVEA